MAKKWVNFKALSFTSYNLKIVEKKIPSLLFAKHDNCYKKGFWMNS